MVPGTFERTQHEQFETMDEINAGFRLAVDNFLEKHPKPGFEPGTQEINYALFLEKYAGNTVLKDDEILERKVLTKEIHLNCFMAQAMMILLSVHALTDPTKWTPGKMNTNIQEYPFFPWANFLTPLGQQFPHCLRFSVAWQNWKYPFKMQKWISRDMTDEPWESVDQKDWVVDQPYFKRPVQLQKANDAIESIKTGQNYEIKDLSFGELYDILAANYLRQILTEAELQVFIQKYDKKLQVLQFTSKHTHTCIKGINALNATKLIFSYFFYN